MDAQSLREQIIALFEDDTINRDQAENMLSAAGLGLMGTTHRASVTARFMIGSEKPIVEHVAESVLENDLTNWLEQIDEEGGFSGDYNVLESDRVIVTVEWSN